MGNNWLENVRQKKGQEKKHPSKKGEGKKTTLGIFGFPILKTQYLLFSTHPKRVLKKLKNLRKFGKLKIKLLKLKGLKFGNK